MTTIPMEPGRRRGPRIASWPAILALNLFVLAPRLALGQAPDPRPSIARDASPLVSALEAEPRGGVESELPLSVQPFAGEGESDLFGQQRILIDLPVYDPWTLSADVGVLHTDNVALSPINELEDTYVRLASGISFDPQLAPDLFGHVHLTQAFYLYDRFDVLDFDFLETGIGFNYYPAPTRTPLDLFLADARIFLDYGYDRTSEPGFGSPIFDNHALLAGWQRLVPVNRSQILILGYTADLSLDASSDLPRRHEHILSAAYRVQWSPEIFTTLAWQSAWHDYFAYGREDWNHGLSFLAECHLSDRATLYASVSWLHNASNFDVFDYERLDFGGLIGVRVPFGGKRQVTAPTGWPSARHHMTPVFAK